MSLSMNMNMNPNKLQLQFELTADADIPFVFLFHHRQSNHKHPIGMKPHPLLQWGNRHAWQVYVFNIATNCIIFVTMFDFDTSNFD